MDEDMLRRKVMIRTKGFTASSCGATNFHQHLAVDVLQIR
jgi:hypothetical protein